MAQTSVRRCQSDACRAPVMTIDHGRPYPMAGVLVLCLAPITVKCHCGAVSTFEREGAKA